MVPRASSPSKQKGVLSIMKGIKDMKQIGTASHPHFTDGKPVPLYEMGGDINTVEGSNRLALKWAISGFSREYGRPPENDAEAWAWNDRKYKETMERYTKETQDQKRKAL